MEWQPFLDEGLLVPCEEDQPAALARVSQGWDGVIAARKSYLACQFDDANEQLREAMAIAAESVCLYHGYRPTQPPSFEFSRRICKAYFKQPVADGIFERAEILGGMLPLPNEQLDPDTMRQIRRSVAASSELCAYLESFVYI